MGSMSIVVKEHGKKLCETMQSLRSDTNLVDLDLVCEDEHLHVHKVVMAASSKFFKEHLCKASSASNFLILKLEDFNLKLKREAVSFLVEFIYKGEVNIPCELLTPVCEAAHALGVQGLTDFLPAPAKQTTPQNVQESSTTNVGGQTVMNNTPTTMASTASSQPTTPTPAVVVPTEIMTNHNVTLPVNQTTLPPPPQWVPEPSNQFPDFYHDTSSHLPPSRNSHQNHPAASMDQSNSQNGLESNSHHDSQPKSRLRIINGSMTSSENIHELKTQNQCPQQQPLDNSVFFNWMGAAGAAPGFDQQCNNIIDLEPSGWYNNQYNYTEEGSSWTTPAATTSSWPTNASTSIPVETSSTLTTSSANTAAEEVIEILSSNSGLQTAPANDTSVSTSKKDEETKLRPPPPLLAKGDRKRPELEVRKDLLPSASATVEEIANVFQAEEDKSSGSQFKCLECSMVFGTDAQLRSHTRHAHPHNNAENTALLLCPICKTAVLQGLENLKVHLYKSHGIGKSNYYILGTLPNARPLTPSASFQQGKCSVVRNVISSLQSRATT